MKLVKLSYVKVRAWWEHYQFNIIRKGEYDLYFGIGNLKALAWRRIESAVEYILKLQIAVMVKIHSQNFVVEYNL